METVEVLSSRWAAKINTERKTILFLDRYYAKREVPGWEDGQPTYSYYCSTILEHNNKLCLDLSVPDWTLSYEEVLAAKQAIHTVLGEI